MRSVPECLYQVRIAGAILLTVAWLQIPSSRSRLQALDIAVLNTAEEKAPGAGHHYQLYSSYSKREYTTSFLSSDKYWGLLNSADLYNIIRPHAARHPQIVISWPS